MILPQILRWPALAAGPLLLSMTLAACGTHGAPGSPGGGADASDSISGAGATFPAPVYAKWADTYHSGGHGSINYQAIGSGGGIRQITVGTVDFGASDKPLKPEDLDKDGLYQFPTVMGGVVPVINVPGISSGQLHMTGALLGDIYLGKVTKWNDPAISSINAGIKLPALPITIVHRSDGSGTSFLFTTYLAMKNAAWSSKVGASDSVNWPVGLGGKGNDGVAANVKQTNGAIGYVEYAYAKNSHMTYVGMQNTSGAFVAPSADSFAAAAAGADWPHAKGNYLLLLDQPGAASWPITGATFILLHKQQANKAKGVAALKFFDWAYKNGDDAARALDYVPMPKSVKDLVRKQWTDTLKASDGSALYTGG
jgi:phosphate transport system substrate-binding protein